MDIATALFPAARDELIAVRESLSPTATHARAISRDIGRTIGIADTGGGADYVRGRARSFRRLAGDISTPNTARLLRQVADIYDRYADQIQDLQEATA